MGSGIGIWMWVEVVCFFPFPWWYFDKSDTESIRFAKRSCKTSRLQPPAPSHLTATLHWWWRCWHNYSQCVAAWCLVWPRAWVAMQHYLLQAAAAATSGTHIATHCHNCHTAQCCLHTTTLPHCHNEWDHSRKTIFWFCTMIRTSELLCTDHLSLLHVKYLQL